MALCGSPESLGRGGMKKGASTVAAKCGIDGAQDAKEGVLDDAKVPVCSRFMA
jgi:hypothetical protein